MATVSTPDTDTTAHLKPLKMIPASRFIGQMRRRIRCYEQRYEIPTAQMLEEVEAGQMRETAEILKWMFAYRVLERLEPETPMGGSRLTATAGFTRNGSKSTTS